jgi:DNA cross-link repair 1C protein
MEDDVILDVKQMLLRGLRSNQKFVSLDDMGLDRDQDDLRLTSLGVILAHSISEKRSKTTNENLEPTPNEKGLPKVITFPYSRHSSYSELCNLVSVFNPKDIYPCTSSEDNWSEGKLRSLECYPISGGIFTPKQNDEKFRQLQYAWKNHSL